LHWTRRLFSKMRARWVASQFGKAEPQWKEVVSE